jgi:hypothetical protein
MERRYGESRGDRAFFDEWKAAFDAHLDRGADPGLMASVLGVTLADLLARCIVGTPLPRPQAEAWITDTCARLHQATWSRVREIKAQPRQDGERP